MAPGERTAFVAVNVLALAVIAAVGVLANQRLGPAAMAGALVLAFLWLGVLIFGVTRGRKPPT